MPGSLKCFYTILNLILTILKKRLSNRLSPSAKKAVLRGKPGKIILGLLQVASSVEFDVLEQQLITLGAEPGAWNKLTHQLTLSVPVERLEALVELDDVVYFETAAPFSR